MLPRSSGQAKTPSRSTGLAVGDERPSLRGGRGSCPTRGRSFSFVLRRAWVSLALPAARSPRTPPAQAASTTSLSLTPNAPLHPRQVVDSAGPRRPSRRSGEIGGLSCAVRRCRTRRIEQGGPGPPGPRGEPQGPAAASAAARAGRRRQVQLAARQVGQPAAPSSFGSAGRRAPATMPSGSWRRSDGVRDRAAGSRARPRRSRRPCSGGPCRPRRSARRRSSVGDPHLPQRAVHVAAASTCIPSTASVSRAPTLVAGPRGARRRSRASSTHTGALTP